MRWSDASGDVREIVQRIKQARVAVFGDFCLDAYWHLFEGEPERSIETGLAVRRVQSQKYSLGGAGSVVANLREMGVEHVRAVGLAGTDAFGEMLRGMLTMCGADTSGFVLDSSWETMVYAKPYLGAKEEGRFDFGSFNTARRELEDALLELLEAAILDSGVVILNQQISCGITSPVSIQRINDLIIRHPHTIFLVDSRHYQQHYRGASLKLNMDEAAELLCERRDSGHPEDRARNFALRISKETGKPAFLTRGEHGIVVAAEGQATVISGLQVNVPVDTVGAGDAVVAALGAAMAAGLNPVSASFFANIVAMITVTKLKSTGTASTAEIVAASENLEYRSASRPLASPPEDGTAMLSLRVARAAYDE